MLLNLLHSEHFNVSVIVSPAVVAWPLKLLVRAINGFHLFAAP
jgi:hypothetical protein